MTSDAGPTSVEAYIAAQPAAAQPRLTELRAIIRAAVPDAAEIIRYGMPTYRCAGSQSISAPPSAIAPCTARP